MVNSITAFVLVATASPPRHPGLHPFATASLWQMADTKPEPTQPNPTQPNPNPALPPTACFEFGHCVAWMPCGSAAPTHILCHR
jgi:hypothetical protein